MKQKVHSEKRKKYAALNFTKNCLIKWYSKWMSKFQITLRNIVVLNLFVNFSVLRTFKSYLT